MYIYSCHDSTLVGLLGTLGVYDFTWPPFGADVRFELYENSKGEKFVRVSYEGEVSRHKFNLWLYLKKNTANLWMTVKWIHKQ